MRTHPQILRRRHLSRRIDARHYIFGKLATVSALVALLTVVPALALFVQYGAFTSSFDYWIDNWRILVSILGYGMVMCAVLSILLVTLSAYLQRMAPIAITWSSLFILLRIIAYQLNEATDNAYWLLVDPWRNMRSVGRSFLGFFPRPEDRELAPWSAAILAAICLLALIALRRRVRAVDIVSQ